MEWSGGGVRSSDLRSTRTTSNEHCMGVVIQVRIWSGSKKINQSKEVLCNQKALFLDLRSKSRPRSNSRFLYGRNFQRCGARSWHRSHSLVLELRVSQRAQLLAPVSAQVCHVGDQGMLLWSVWAKFVHYRKGLERHILEVILITDVVYDQQSKCLNEFAFVCFGNTDNAKEAKEHSGEMEIN